MKCLVPALVLAAACGSGSTPNPWARRWTEADRLAWPAGCGDGSKPVGVETGGGLAIYSIESAPPDGALSLVSCQLTWDEKRKRVRYLQASFLLRANVIPTPAQIAPYAEPLIREVPPALQATVREVAYRRNTEQEVRVPPFVIEGGYFDPGRGGWHLRVRLQDAW